jgi:hypothetical protein
MNEQPNAQLRMILTNRGFNIGRVENVPGRTTVHFYRIEDAVDFFELTAKRSAQLGMTPILSLTARIGGGEGIAIPAEVHWTDICAPEVFAAWGVKWPNS